jgi:hydroxysqualene dehydroxylase
VSAFKRVHVVGAGLAGLAASLRLAEAGVAVILHEAAPQAGGRCRSYADATLGLRIDNGNHMLGAANRAALNYIDAIGARATLTETQEPRYAFLDLASGERWNFRPNRSRVPWWMLSAGRRIPGVAPWDYARAASLLRAGPDQTVTDVLAPDTTIFRRLWRPLATAALNTEPEHASARLLATVLRETFGAGGAACAPVVLKDGLSETLVDPALAKLKSRGASIRFGSRLRAIETEDERVAWLRFEDGDEFLGPEEAAVLAVPAPVAPRLLPGLEAPDEFRAILNAHFRYVAPADAPWFVGLIGGTAEWVYRKAEVLSVTISAADRFMDRDAEELAPLLWPDICRAYDLGAAPMPAWQIVKERRATIAATPAQERRRPGAATRWRNLALAGDWTATGLPATIEGAIRSGNEAAAKLMEERR